MPPLTIPYIKDSSFRANAYFRTSLGPSIYTEIIKLINNFGWSGVRPTLTESQRLFEGEAILENQLKNLGSPMLSNIVAFDRFFFILIEFSKSDLLDKHPAAVVTNFLELFKFVSMKFFEYSQLYRRRLILSQKTLNDLKKNVQRGHTTRSFTFLTSRLEFKADRKALGGYMFYRAVNAKKSLKNPIQAKLESWTAFRSLFAGESKPNITESNPIQFISMPFGTLNFKIPLIDFTIDPSLDQNALELLIHSKYGLNLRQQELCHVEPAIALVMLNKANIALILTISQRIKEYAFLIEAFEHKHMSKLKELKRSKGLNLIGAYNTLLAETQDNLSSAECILKNSRKIGLPYQLGLNRIHGLLGYLLLSPDQKEFEKNVPRYITNSQEYTDQDLLDDALSPITASKQEILDVVLFWNNDFSETLSNLTKLKITDFSSSEIALKKLIEKFQNQPENLAKGTNPILEWTLRAIECMRLQILGIQPHKSDIKIRIDPNNNKELRSISWISDLSPELNRYNSVLLFFNNSNFLQKAKLNCRGAQSQIKNGTPNFFYEEEITRLENLIKTLKESNVSTCDAQILRIRLLNIVQPLRSTAEREQIFTKLLFKYAIEQYCNKMKDIARNIRRNLSTEDIDSLVDFIRYPLIVENTLLYEMIDAVKTESLKSYCMSYVQSDSSTDAHMNSIMQKLPELNGWIKNFTLGSVLKDCIPTVTISADACKIDKIKLARKAILSGNFNRVKNQEQILRYTGSKMRSAIRNSLFAMINYMIRNKTHKQAQAVRPIKLNSAQTKSLIESYSGIFSRNYRGFLLKNLHTFLELLTRPYSESECATLPPQFIILSNFSVDEIYVITELFTGYVTGWTQCRIEKEIFKNLTKNLVHHTYTPTKAAISSSLIVSLTNKANDFTTLSKPEAKINIVNPQNCTKTLNESKGRLRPFELVELENIFDMKEVDEARRTEISDLKHVKTVDDSVAAILKAALVPTLIENYLVPNSTYFEKYVELETQCTLLPETLIIENSTESASVSSAMSIDSYNSRSSSSNIVTKAIGQ